MKAWAESNPEAAEKQRIKLGADPFKEMIGTCRCSGLEEAVQALGTHW